MYNLHAKKINFKTDGSKKSCGPNTHTHTHDWKHDFAHTRMVINITDYISCIIDAGNPLISCGSQLHCRTHREANVIYSRLYCVRESGVRLGWSCPNVIILRVHSIKVILVVRRQLPHSIIGICHNLCCFDSVATECQVNFKSSFRNDRYHWLNPKFTLKQKKNKLKLKQKQTKFVLKRKSLQLHTDCLSQDTQIIDTTHYLR